MKWFLVLFVSLFLFGCVKTGCNVDSDCSVGGCSGQLCGLNEDVEGAITTCEFKPEYACYKLTECGCVNNKCQWEKTSKFEECLNNQKSI